MSGSARQSKKFDPAMRALVADPAPILLFGAHTYDTTPITLLTSQLPALAKSGFTHVALELPKSKVESEPSRALIESDPHLAIFIGAARREGITVEGIDHHSDARLTVDDSPDRPSNDALHELIVSLGEDNELEIAEKDMARRLDRIASEHHAKRVIAVVTPERLGAHRLPSYLSNRRRKVLPVHVAGGLCVVPTEAQGRIMSMVSRAGLSHLTSVHPSSGKGEKGSAVLHLGSPSLSIKYWEEALQTEPHLLTAPISDPAFPTRLLNDLAPVGRAGDLALVGRVAFLNNQPLVATRALRVAVDRAGDGRSLLDYAQALVSAAVASSGSPDEAQKLMKGSFAAHLQAEKVHALGSSESLAASVGILTQVFKGTIDVPSLVPRGAIGHGAER